MPGYAHSNLQPQLRTVKNTFAPLLRPGKTRNLSQLNARISKGYDILILQSTITIFSFRVVDEKQLKII